MSTANVWDVYQIVTNRIIAQLEKGFVPWQQSWTKAGAPKNLISGKVYRGINLWMLASLKYEQNYFLTANQAKGLGGNIRKDEVKNGHLVVYWATYDQPQENREETVTLSVLRYYEVFNIAQCEGIPADKIPKRVVQHNDPLKICEDILRYMPNAPLIQHDYDEPYYWTYRDHINMPKMETFADRSHYYGMLFHELIHSTGHKKRLNRKELMSKESWEEMDYSQEELTAEIGAYYLRSFTGIATEPTENSIAYINGWLDLLKRDRKCIIYASIQAQKATDYILNVVDADASGYAPGHTGNEATPERL